MVAELVAIAADHGCRRQVPTAIARLSIWCSSEPTNPTPAMFEPKFYVLLQGAKRLTFGRLAHDFRAGHCAVSAIGVPFTSQVTEASPDAPYIGLELKLDAGIVASLLLDMPAIGEGKAPAFAVAAAMDDVMEPLGRLVRLLSRPADIPVLANQFERELCYRLLQSSLGGTLRQIVQKNSRFDQIRTAAQWISHHAHEPMRVQELAASVGMSVTSFHRHFKAVTAHSPLAYQRHVRLLEARRLLTSGAANVTEAAFATGYASSSQFSREYKRMFRVAPKRDVHLVHTKPLMPRSEEVVACPKPQSSPKVVVRRQR